MFFCLIGYLALFVAVFVFELHNESLRANFKLIFYRLANLGTSDSKNIFFIIIFNFLLRTRVHDRWIDIGEECWRRNISVTSWRYWWLYDCDRGKMLFKMSPIHFLSNIRHQQRWNNHRRVCEVNNWKL